MANLAELKVRLSDAELALHQLMTGEREVQVEIGGYGETTFSQVSRKDLEAYIGSLKDTIAKLEGRLRRRPMRVRF